MFSRIVALLTAAVLVASACSSSAEQAADPESTIPPASSAAVVAPSAPTTEASASATTEPAPTSTSEPAADDDAQVREVHTRFMTELYDRDERVDGGPEAFLEEARELATGPVLARIEQNVASDIDTGQRVAGPGYVSNIIDLQVDGDRANVVDCSQDRGVLYDAADVVVTPADDFFKLRATQLVRIDGRWLVEDFHTGGDERCEPPGAS